MITNHIDKLISGVFLMLLGWSPVVVYFVKPWSEPLDTITTITVAVFIIDCSIAFSIIGWWTLTDKIKTKDDPTLTEAEKTKSNFHTTILILPAILAFTVLVFAKSDSTIWKLFFVLVTIYCFHMILKHLKFTRGV